LPNQFRPGDGERVPGLGRRIVGFCHARSVATRRARGKRGAPSGFPAEQIKIALDLFISMY